MGFFSSIGNFFKGILNGIKSVFQWVGKILSSPVGKALMIGAAVFTAGTALLAGTAAGIASAQTGAGFLDSFVQGGSSFVQALGSPLTTASSIANNGLMATGQALAEGTDSADLGATAAAEAGASPETAAEQAASANATAAGSGSAAAGAPSVGVNSSQVAAGDLASTEQAAGAGTGTAQVAQTPIGELTNPENASAAGQTPGATSAQTAVTPVSGNAPNAGPLNTSTQFGNPAANGPLNTQTSFGPGSTPPSFSGGGSSGAPYSGNADVGATGAGSANGGLLSQVAGYVSKIPAPVAIVGGQALSGYAQGKAAENIANRQWQEQQYTNNLWGVNSPTAAAEGVVTAAGQPLTINSGYLQHAQNIANFMNGKLANSPPTVVAGTPNVQVGTPQNPVNGSAPVVGGGGSAVPTNLPPTAQGG